MKDRLARLRDAAAAYVAGALAATLVISDVIGAIPWDPAWTARLAAMMVPFQGAGGDVRNYVLFTTASAGDLLVTTGTRFASTGSPRITGQWCYVERTIAENDRRTVTLAAIDETGAVSRTAPPSSALLALALGADEFSRLVDTHCRFQPDGRT